MQQEKACPDLWMCERSVQVGCHSQGRQLFSLANSGSPCKYFRSREAKECCEAVKDMESSSLRIATAAWGFFVTLAATITVEGKMSC